MRAQSEPFIAAPYSESITLPFWVTGASESECDVEEGKQSLGYGESRRII
jgi:hypothetical protein